MSSLRLGSILTAGCFCFSPATFGWTFAMRINTKVRSLKGRDCKWTIPIFPSLFLSFPVFCQFAFLIELRGVRIGHPGAKRGRDKEELTMRLRVTQFRPRSVSGGPSLPSPGQERVGVTKKLLTRIPHISSCSHVYVAAAGDAKASHLRGGLRRFRQPEGGSMPPGAGTDSLVQ